MIFGLLVYDLIFDVDILTDHASAEYDAVADDGALFDDTAAADDGILGSCRVSCSRWIRRNF